MQIRRMAGVAALSAAVASTLVVPSAGAETPTPVEFEAGASGRSLALTVFGQELTIGGTATTIDSTVRALADGLGLATPLFRGGESSAEATSGTSGSEAPVCENSFGEIPGLLIELACSASLAQVLDGVPGALAVGSVGDITVNPVQALLDTPLGEVVAPVEDAVTTLLDGLRPITTAVDDAAGLGLEDTLDDLFGALFAGADLVSIRLGDTVAQNLLGNESVTASCASQAGRIDVLDLPAVGGVDPAPVLSVIVSDALASVAATTRDGQATPSVTPALVRVVVPSLGLDVPVSIGQTLEIPLPEPLGTSVISVADGLSGVDELGRTFATANAVSLDLLNGSAMMGGVELDLAGCTSFAQVLPAQIPRTTAPPTTEVELPRTGAEGPSTPALAVTLGLAGAALALVRRSRIGA